MNLGEIANSELVTYHGRNARAAENLEFIAWDGEGITPPGETRQNFVLFGNSKGFRVSAHRLTTLECLNLIIDSERAFPKAVHVGFAFGYDTEMILGDLEFRHLHQMYRHGHVRWNGFRIEYRKGKWLQITKMAGNTKDRISARIWDVWSFFSTSFVQAIREYLGEIPELQMIEGGKASRGDFTYDQLDEHITPYWQAELRLTVDLMNSLRSRLYGAGLKIRQWHGPGAIATYAMRQNGVSKAMDREVPLAVNNCAQFAYAGGRFELFKMGWQHEKVYAYDIRSAYPSAIARLPNLSTGVWRHVENPTRVARFGVYRIRHRDSEIFSLRPMPYFYRDERAAIHYPNSVEGWYWSPEARLAQYHGSRVEILEGWEYEDDGTSPLEWIRDVYDTRAEWKREGNPSQIALKLLMNSMYGKFAQRVGWERFNGPPRWHQLEWAGYVTSYARATLYRAMAEAHTKGGLLGVETDGIFSSVRLSLDIGPNLGQWEEDIYDQMIYLQSGFYFKNQDGKWTAKYRGFDKGSVSVSDAQKSLEAWKPWQSESKGSLLGTTTRFTSMGLYLRIPNGKDWRNVWITAPRDLSMGNDGKRIHRIPLCIECQQEHSPAEHMHGLTVSHPTGGVSIPHSLPWMKAQPNPFREIIDELGAPE